MEGRTFSRTSPANPHCAVIVLGLLMMCMTLSNGALFCPPAVVNAQYEIVAENYNVNTSDLNNLKITWYFGSTTLSTCNLTTQLCQELQTPRDRNLTYFVSAFGVDARQLKIVIANFFLDLQERYSIVWEHQGSGVQTNDSCVVSVGNPIDECANQSTCVNYTSCSDLVAGFKCICTLGYGGMNCREGDMKMYCDLDSYQLQFDRPGDACGLFDIHCYIAGAGYLPSRVITAQQTRNSNIPYFMASAKVSAQTVSFNVCTAQGISNGSYEIIYDLQSTEALANFTFQITADVGHVNYPPVFNILQEQRPYLINVSVAEPYLSVLVYVNKSNIETCKASDGCIQVIDADFNKAKGIESLTIRLALGNLDGWPIIFVPQASDDSLAYFYVAGALTKGTRLLFLISVYDGEQAFANTEVVFRITEENFPPVCDLSEIHASLDIRTPPVFNVGTVKCADNDTEPQYRIIRYTVTGMYSDYFSVLDNGTIQTYRPVLVLDPGELNFNVTATGYSAKPNPDFESYIPVSVILTVLEPHCNLTLTSVPPTWQVNSTSQLRLTCDNTGLDKLRVMAWGFPSIFNATSVKESVTVIGITLKVIQFQPGQYNFTITATLGGLSSVASVLIKMYNPPTFTTYQRTESIDETAHIGYSLLSLLATTDTPNAIVSVTLISGDPDYLFRDYRNGFISLDKELRSYVGQTFHLVLEAMDSVSNFTSQYLWNLTVLDTNESPICPVQYYSLTIRSSLPPGITFMKVPCSDPDITPEFNQLRYNIFAVSSTAQLNIDGNGSVSLVQPVPLGVLNFQAVVNVTDMTFTVSVNLNITVVVVYCTRDRTELGLFFPATPVNSMGTANCSSLPLYTGYVSRFCHLNETWGQFNYTNCRRDLQNLTDYIKDLTTDPGNHTSEQATDVVKIVADELSQSIISSSVILSGDIKQIVKILSGVREITRKYGDVRVDGNTLERYAFICDNLLGAGVGMWNDVNKGKDEEGALLITAMDDITKASLRAEDPNFDVPIVKSFIAIKRAITGDDIIFPNRNDPAYQDRGDWVLSSNNTAFLRKDAFFYTYGNIKYAVLLYQNASEKLRINNEIQTDPQLIDKVLNSDILTFTIDRDIPVLSPPLLLSFSALQQNFSNASCGYLNTHTSEDGLWASGGCTATVRQGLVECSCSHLTNFALLMSPYGRASVLDTKILSIISAIGCGISIFCLLVTIIVYIVLWKYVKCDRAALHIQLSVCLVIAYVIFLVGVDRTDSPIGCKVVATLLHYIYLVVFCVMLSEGIEIFKSVSFVFSSKSILWKLIPVSYGVPLIIVAVSLAVTKTEGYGDEFSCWLSTSNGLIWAFIGPVLCVLFVNYLILFQVVRIMQSTKHQMTRDFLQRSKSVVRTLCVLSPLLGLTWVFGVLSVNKETVVFQYLFAIFNSLQGLAIFICYCLVAPQVRDGFRAMKRKQRARSRDYLQNDSSSAPDTKYSQDSSGHKSRMLASRSNLAMGHADNFAQQTDSTMMSDSLNDDHQRSYPYAQPQISHRHEAAMPHGQIGHERSANLNASYTSYSDGCVTSGNGNQGRQPNRNWNK